MKKLAIILSLLFTMNIFAVSAFAGEKEENFKEILEILQENYVNELDEDKLYEGAIKGMLESLDDPYTVYFDTYDFESFLQEFETSYSGIGVQIAEHALGAEIISIFKNSPAQKAGLRVGDIITAADGVSIAQKTPSEASKLIRGSKGTKVKLTVKRKDKEFTVYVVRDVIENPSVEYKVIDKLGYIKINEFKDDTAKLVAQALKSFETKKVSGLILDLRDNPGGELQAAVEVSELLLPAGPVLQIVYEGDKKHVVEAAGPGFGKPIVVLINKGSASASEVVAGALQERKAALLIGEKSFGKASVQSIIPLQSSGGLKMTVAHYLTPNGRFIHNKGIDPDLFFYKEPGHSGVDPVLEKAVALLKSKNYKKQKVSINKNLKISVNQKALKEKAVFKQGRYYLPLRSVAQELGLYISMEGDYYIIKAKQRVLILDKKQILLKNNKGYIPLGIIFKEFKLAFSQKTVSSVQFQF